MKKNCTLVAFLYLFPVFLLLYPLLCLVLTHLGKKEEAYEILESNVVKRPSIGSNKGETYIYSDNLFLEASVLTGHRQAAELLLPRIRSTSLCTSGIWCPTCIPRHLGGAAALLERYDEAVEVLKKSIRLRPNFPADAYY